MERLLGGGGGAGAGQLMLQALVPVLQLVERLLQAQEGGLQLADPLLVILWGRIETESDTLSGRVVSSSIHASGDTLGSHTDEKTRHGSDIKTKM